ncbi:MAG: UDP-2,4-diacetamido-2,4,6-trideoxy-beta-L-altropyranose hydrolase [Bacteroidia bacterium]|jgi:UDP-2,4-diacetamido-2,4,6-trideoxy-beta-L-altropyranose hydrolase|nr:UDP-2,4-diacetamido-2,4,6-trideoxy-beta-L-altropyranose hydrolase [Bacteroidia bacterium]
MTVYFRADGNEQVGLGHIVRCTALAEMIEENFNPVFILKNSSSSALQMIEQMQFPQIIIEEEQEFFNLLSTSSIAVTDGYEFDSSYFNKIIETGSKLVCIDDMVNTFYPAHLIINQNPAFTPKDYQAAPYTQFAIGLKYALLRKPFRDAISTNKKAKKNGKYFIAMGGMDPLDLSEPIVENLKSILPDENISLLVSKNKLKYYLNKFPKIKIYHGLDAKEMCDIMLDHQYLICPASSVAIEGLSVSMELICGYYAENQKSLYQYYVKNNMVEDAGYLSESIQQLIQLITNKKHDNTAKNNEIGTTSYTHLFNRLMTL